MSSEMSNVRDAILSEKATAKDYAGLPVPQSMLAITTHKDEVRMFDGLESDDKDPRRSLHLDEVAVPEVGPNEALLLCPANLAPPSLVAPYPGAAGYEALATCLGPPDVRARGEAVVPLRPEALKTRG